MPDAATTAVANTCRTGELASRRTVADSTHPTSDCTAPAASSTGTVRSTGSPGVTSTSTRAGSRPTVVTMVTSAPYAIEKSSNWAVSLPDP